MPRHHLGHGYARTPIRLIAKESGVVPQTIHAHFGSKAGVLTGLVDLMDEEAGLPELIAEAAVLTDPEDLLGLPAKAARQVRERCGDIAAMLGSGAAVDPAITASRAESERRNRAGTEMIVERIRQGGHPVATRAGSGWSHDDYEVRLRRTRVTAVLATKAAS